jgi:methylenetetrahydrofolate dehydrogenase (NADP+) / methenyltetrahydrofolate cyclohydrolase
MSILLSGKPAREAGKMALLDRMSTLFAIPTLAIIQIGDSAASTAYVGQKQRFGEEIGARVLIRRFSIDVDQREVLETIEGFNDDPSVHGIIVQLPLPLRLDRGRIINAIVPEKDVDGLSAISIARRHEGKGGFVPATPRGIKELLDFYQVPLVGKRIAVMGRSALVGAPAAELFEREGADVSIVHSETENPTSITREADILIVAIGRPEFVGAPYVRAGQVVVDVGINTKEGALLEEVGKRQLVGDVRHSEVEPIVSAITPVPGGVGLMTVLALFENLCDAAFLSQGRAA